METYEKNKKRGRGWDIIKLINLYFFNRYSYFALTFSK
jgi:hypothetical protein